MQLLPTPSNGVPTVSSLEIAALTGKRHDDVLKDIRRILEESEIGLGQFAASYLNTQNKQQPCYHLPKMECDLVISGYSVKYRLAIIKRWHELEAKIAAPMALPTHSEALRGWANALEANEAQAAQIEAQATALTIAAPKVEFHDTVMASETVCQLAVACQVAKLAFGRNILYRKLREMGVLIDGGHRHNLPMQDYIKRGIFTVEESKYNHPHTDEPIIKFTTHATQKGIAWLIKTFKGVTEPAEIE
jgi:Rha family phage regulatory protein